LALPGFFGGGSVESSVAVKQVVGRKLKIQGSENFGVVERVASGIEECLGVVDGGKIEERNGGGSCGVEASENLSVIFETRGEG